jgi:hypothetical protein
MESYPGSRLDIRGTHYEAMDGMDSDDDDGWMF